MYLLCVELLIRIWEEVYLFIALAHMAHFCSKMHTPVSV